MTKNLLMALWDDESGATAVEYGLIVAIMAALLFVVLGGFSDKLRDLFDAISDKLDEATDEISNPE